MAVSLTTFAARMADLADQNELPEVAAAFRQQDTAKSLRHGPVRLRLNDADAIAITGHVGAALQALDATWRVEASPPQLIATEVAKSLAAAAGAARLNDAETAQAALGVALVCVAKSTGHADAVTEVVTSILDGYEVAALRTGMRALPAVDADVQRVIGDAIVSEAGREVDAFKVERKDSGWRSIAKGGIFYGPRGGKWADAAHTIPYSEPAAGAKPAAKPEAEPEAKPEAKKSLSAALDEWRDTANSLGGNTSSALAARPERAVVTCGGRDYQRHGDGWIAIDDEGAAMGEAPMSHRLMAAKLRKA